MKKSSKMSKERERERERNLFTASTAAVSAADTLSAVLASKKQRWWWQ